MNTTRRRQEMRVKRQLAAKALLSPQQIQMHPIAADLFAKFSGKRGKSTNARSFESFVEQR